MLVKLPAVALNVAEATPEPTVTDAGTVNAVLVSVRVTAAPPAGAAPERITVHVELPPDVTVLGEHANEDTTTAVARLTVALAELPL